MTQHSFIQDQNVPSERMNYFKGPTTTLLVLVVQTRKIMTRPSFSLIVLPDLPVLAGWLAGVCKCAGCTVVDFETFENDIEKKRGRNYPDI